MPHPSWNESYAAGQMPWDAGEPEPLLVEFVTSGAMTPGPALEIGAGTGTNAIWMAERGFDVLGVDLAPLAVALREYELAYQEAAKTAALAPMRTANPMPTPIAILAGVDMWAR